MPSNSTRSVWEGGLKNHLEPEWKDVPIDLITFDAVSEWAAKKRAEGLSWSRVKDSSRTMQRVVSAFVKDTGGTNQFPGGSDSRCGPSPFHGARD